MVLIDEYDALVNRGIRISEESVDFSSGVEQSLELFQRIKVNLNRALLHLAFFTGLTPIALRVFGSLLNNATDHTRLPTFAYACGMLGRDVGMGLRIALARHVGAAELDARVEKEKHIMRVAYNGYRFTTSPAPLGPGIESVFNSTCVAYYIAMLSRQGSVPPTDLEPPAISLSDSQSERSAAIWPCSQTCWLAKRQSHSSSSTLARSWFRTTEGPHKHWHLRCCTTMVLRRLLKSRTHCDWCARTKSSRLGSSVRYQVLFAITRLLLEQPWRSSLRAMLWHSSTQCSKRDH